MSMNLLDVLLLSVVEGLTEFLPISSTGHLILTSHLLQIKQSVFLSTFLVVIQLGAILAVALIYRKTLLKNLALWKKIIVAFIPTGIVGFTLYPVIKNILLGNELITEAALFLGGIIFILIENFHKEKNVTTKTLEHVSLKQALLVGIFQSFSVIPGVSRSGATIIGGLSLGISRKAAVEFSFLLAIPTMTAATGYDLLKTQMILTQQEYVFLVLGFITVFIIAFVAVKVFLKYIVGHTFIPFGFYRIFLALIYYFIFLH